MAGRDFVAQSRRPGPNVPRRPTRREEVLQQKLMAKVVPALRGAGRRRRIGHHRAERERRRPGSPGDANLRPRAGPAGATRRTLSLIDQYTAASRNWRATTALKVEDRRKWPPRTKLNHRPRPKPSRSSKSSRRSSNRTSRTRRRTSRPPKNRRKSRPGARPRRTPRSSRKRTRPQVAGLRTAVEGFNSADQFAQYQMVMRLAPALKEVFASDTSDFAKLFAAYMTQTPG